MGLRNPQSPKPGACQDTSGHPLRQQAASMTAGGLDVPAGLSGDSTGKLPERVYLSCGLRDRRLELPLRRDGDRGGVHQAGPRDVSPGKVDPRFIDS